MERDQISQQQQQKQQRSTRRGFLQHAAIVGAGVTTGGVSAIAGSGQVDAAGRPSADVATIVNLATTVETLAVTFYYTAITAATFHMDAASVACLTVTMEQEMRHLHTLRSRGGVARQQHFYLPDRLLSDARVFVRTGLTAEQAFTSLYLTATRHLAALGQPPLAATAAHHAAGHAQHLTLIGHLAGLPAHDLTLTPPSVDPESDAERTLAPYLTGGAGFRGPIAVPSARQYQAARGTRRAEHGQPVATT